MRRKLAVTAAVVSALCAPLVFQRNGVSQPTPHRIEVVAKRFRFQPSELTVKQGEPVLLVVKSEDVGHGLRFKELNVDVKTPKNGGTAQVQFTPAVAGDFVGHCSVFCGTGHGSMILTLHVVP